MTRKYDIEALLELNASYQMRHGLKQADADMANEFVELIEHTRSTSRPKAGDILRYTTRHGDYYHMAHIDTIKNGVCEICQQPYIPFIYNDNDTGIACSTSGGPWTSVPAKGLKYVGSEGKLFKDWGHCGPCGNGAVTFEASVSVWEYAEPEAFYGDFTTKTWRKLIVRKKSEDEMKTGEYLYSGDGIAFRNDAEFESFLRLHKATLFPGYWPGQSVVWCYREKIVQVEHAEFDKLDLPEVTVFCNGPRTGKVSYDDNNHTTVIKIIKLNP